MQVRVKGNFRSAKIIACTRPESEINCWYRDKIGDIIKVKQSAGNPNLMYCFYEMGSTGKINKADLSFKRKDIKNDNSQK